MLEGVLKKSQTKLTETDRAFGAARVNAPLPTKVNHQAAEFHLPCIGETDRDQKTLQPVGIVDATVLQVQTARLVIGKHFFNPVVMVVELVNLNRIGQVGHQQPRLGFGVFPDGCEIDRTLVPLGQGQANIVVKGPQTTNRDLARSGPRAIDQPVRSGLHTQHEFPRRFGRQPMRQMNRVKLAVRQQRHRRVRRQALPHPPQNLFLQRQIQIPLVRNVNQTQRQRATAKPGRDRQQIQGVVFETSIHDQQKRMTVPFHPFKIRFTSGTNYPQAGNRSNRGRERKRAVLVGNRFFLRFNLKNQ